MRIENPQTRKMVRIMQTAYRGLSSDAIKKRLFADSDSRSPRYRQERTAQLLKALCESGLAMEYLGTKTRPRRKRYPYREPLRMYYLTLRRPVISLSDEELDTRHHLRMQGLI